MVRLGFLLSSLILIWAFFASYPERLKVEHEENMLGRIKNAMCERKCLRSNKCSCLEENLQRRELEQKSNLIVGPNELTLSYRSTQILEMVSVKPNSQS